MNTIRPEVNNKIFSWAIARKGLSASDVVSVYPKFIEWQNGTAHATVKQLKDFSKRYYFPFGYFFLDSVPENAKPAIPFFRCADEYNTAEDINVNETVEILQERQAWLSDYFKENNADKNPVIGIYRNEKDMTTILQGISSYLEFEDDWNLKLKTPEKTLAFLGDKFEERNIIATFNSIVNNNAHRAMPVKLCRGFCLVDDYVPFIFVNSADSKKAQIFTMLHELVHIFISFTAGFGDCGVEKLPDSRESLCDKIAAEILVPKNLLLKYKASKSNAELSDYFKASEIVILRRKLDCGLISKSQFFAEYNNLSPYKKIGRSGGNFYATAEQRINPKFLRCLNNAMHNRSITPMEAYHLAGLKGDTFTRLAAGGNK